MTCLSKNKAIEIMKFFLNTSVPKILSERKGITSKQKRSDINYAYKYSNLC